MAQIHLQCIQMRSNKAGWLGAKNEENEGMEIFYTEDGASNWKNVTPEHSMIRLMFFFGLETAYLFGYVSVEGILSPTVFFTHNKGKSWGHSLLPIEEDGRPLSAFIDFSCKKNGWLLASSDPFSTILYRTRNGGKTWAKVGHVPIAGVPVGIRFINEMDGWVAVKAQSNRSCLYKTNNGGKNWRLVNLPFPSEETSPAQAMTCFKPVSLDDLLIVPVMTDDGSTKSLMFFTSHNLGQTWKASNEIPFTGGGALSFIDAHHGRAIDAEAGAVYKSKKEFKKWEIWTQADLLKGTRCLHFTDPHNGWACSKKSILHTKNRGKSWEEIQFTIH
ncbi:YCF48-related protein [Fictibacillus sp. Mic-4]|uniref:WD40/YVTN/BNR-like repeat-containing protein n=1 Tax=Fictibacillus sp. Mic-4 TaxID=3132826 RepID=UPI003CE7EBD1